VTYKFLPPLRLDDVPLSSRHDQLAGIKQPGGQKLLHYDEVQKHNVRDDCWVIIDVGPSPSRLLNELTFGT
jgi:L-lactate dehydrogenase (cytochrome)